MKYLGIFLIILGVAIAAGYGIYYLGKGFFNNPDIHPAIRVAVPTVVLGLVLWLIAYIRDKFRESAMREPSVIVDTNMAEMDDRDVSRRRR